MGFDRFEDAGKQIDGPTFLSVSPTSPGYLTATAVREWFGDADVVTFYVDRENSRLGINPGEESDGAYHLTGSDGGASVAMKKVLKRFDLVQEDLDETYHAPLEWDNEHGMVVADLTSIVEAETDAAHCDECGRRFASPSAAKQHATKIHDGAFAAVRDADPEDVFDDDVPEGDDSYKQLDQKAQD